MSTILGLLLEPIKHEFVRADAQLGFLGGISFAIFYATVGIPIAALADRTNRHNVLAVAMVAWSAMTTLCGMAVNFILLVVARIGTGGGEAGATLIMLPVLILAYLAPSLWIVVPTSSPNVS